MKQYVFHSVRYVVWHYQKSLYIQGRNQDLNLTKQKYEILTGHIRIIAKNVIK